MLTDPLTYSYIHTLTLFLSHMLTDPLTYSYIHTLTLFFSHMLTDLLTYSYIEWVSEHVWEEEGECVNVWVSE